MFPRRPACLMIRISEGEEGNDWCAQAFSSTREIIEIKCEIYSERHDWCDGGFLLFPAMRCIDYKDKEEGGGSKSEGQIKNMFVRTCRYRLMAGTSFYYRKTFRCAVCCVWIALYVTPKHIPSDFFESGDSVSEWVLSEFREYFFDLWFDFPIC